MFLMKTVRKTLIASLILQAVTILCCSAQPGIKPVPKIEWDTDTLVLIQRGGLYGRVIRLGNNALLCSSEKGGKVYVCNSRDDGKNWVNHHIAAEYEYGSAANPEILQSI